MLMMQEKKALRCVYVCVCMYVCMCEMEVCMACIACC
jgi:hypothetical protein